MARKIVGLIGNGKGPTIHVEGRCTAIIEGLREGGIVSLDLNEGAEYLFFEANGSFPLEGKPRRINFSADRASRELVCRILMEA